MGFLINNISDSTLINLRKTDTKQYSIPRGGLFDYISCPNFFGEIIEWLGFAILTWSIAGLAFFLWTFFNLVPRDGRLPRANKAKDKSTELTASCKPSVSSHPQPRAVVRHQVASLVLQFLVNPSLIKCS